MKFSDHVPSEHIIVLVEQESLSLPLDKSNVGCSCIIGLGTYTGGPSNDDKSADVTRIRLQRAYWQTNASSTKSERIPALSAYVWRQGSGSYLTPT
eukprot:2286175-Amphidinium_carterae.1